LSNVSGILSGYRFLFLRMIKYQSSSQRTRWTVAILLAAISTGMAVWWISTSKPEPSAVSDASGGAEGGSMWPQAGVGEEGQAVTLATPSVLGDGRPADISEADWATLLSVLAKMGKTPEDAIKLVEQVRFQRSFEKLQTLDNPEDAAVRRRMAQTLMSELPERLKDGEFTLMEATFMGASLIAETESEDSQRNAALVQWQMQLAKLVPDFENDVAIAKLSQETQMKRLQASAYAEWVSEPNPALRTAARLEQLMEQARRDFNSGAQ
jgi:hypothetical protein